MIILRPWGWGQTCGKYGYGLRAAGCGLRAAGCGLRARNRLTPEGGGAVERRANAL